MSPTRSPALSSNETFCKTDGSWGAYLMERSSTTTSGPLPELEGQYAGGLWDSMIAGGSCGRSVYSMILSTELKADKRRTASDEGHLLEIELEPSPKPASPIHAVTKSKSRLGLRLVEVSYLGNEDGL